MTIKGKTVKKINISLIVLLAMGSLAYAGGDFSGTTAYEDEDTMLAEEVVPQAPAVQAMPLPIPPPPPLEDINPNGLYVGLGLSNADFKCNCVNCNDEDRTMGLMGRVGYDFNQYVGVEARGIKTNWKVDGGKVEHFGAFVKPMYPVSEDINAYALAGYGKTTTQGYLQHVNSNAFAWGLGLEYDLESDEAKVGKYDRDFDGYGDQEGGFGLFADYERLIQKSGSPDLDTFNIGVTYDF